MFRIVYNKLYVISATSFQFKNYSKLKFFSLEFFCVVLPYSVFFLISSYCKALTIYMSLCLRFKNYNRLNENMIGTTIQIVSFSVNLFDLFRL